MQKIATLEKYKFSSYEEIRDLENPDKYTFEVEYPDGSMTKSVTRIDEDNKPFFNGVKDEESDYDTYFAEYNDCEARYYVVPIEDYALCDIVAYKSI